MKKHPYVITITLLTLMFYSTTLSAQYQSIFGNQQTSWYMHSWEVTPENINCDPDSMWILYGQDTTFQAKTFKPLMKNWTSQQGGVLHGFISEDTSSGELWFRYSGIDTVIYKMMDMSLTANDTFYYNTGSLGTYPFAVDSVYYSNSRKIIELEYQLGIENSNGITMVNYTMIEGVGVNLRGVYYDQANSILKHHWKDSALVYNSTLDSVFYCDTLTSLFERGRQVAAFDIFPNPIRETANITLNEIDAERIDLIDLSGRLIKSFSTKENELNFSEVSNGVYFVRITTAKQEQFTQKVVVQK